MKDVSLTWQLADIIARELVKRETDVNEVHKAVTYARIHTDGAKFFALVETMARDGRYLVRSGRTLDYYRELQEVCKQHLSRYRTATGEQALELVDILGWAVRLMRYYRTGEGQAELAERQRGEHSKPRPQPHLQPRPQGRQSTTPSVRVVTKRESVTLVTRVRSGKAQVRIPGGHEVACTGIPAYPGAKEGEQCRADVIYQDGKPIRGIFKGWR